MTSGLLCALVLFAATVCFASPDVASSFDSANKFYDQGKYIEAADAYEKLAADGPVSAALYYNLGNALFKTGQLGRAIAAYHQAEQLAPRDADLRANLQFARNQVQGPTWHANFWHRRLRTLSLGEWTGLTVAAFWLTFLPLAVGQIRPSLKNGFRKLAWVAGLATVLLGVCFGFALHERLTGNKAIVVVNDLTVRSGPFEEAQGSFTAHDGAEFRVLDRKDDWYQVSDGAGRIGWLKRDNVIVRQGV